MGRSKKSTSGRREHSAVLSAISKTRHGAFTLEYVVKDFIGIHMPHNIIHKMLRDADISENQSKKSKHHKWIRYERTFSNSMGILITSS